MMRAKLGKTRIWVTFLFSLTLFASGLLLNTSSVSAARTASAATAVSLQVSGMNATISNGIYTVKFNSQGTGYSLVYNGKELVGPGLGILSTVNGYTNFSPTQLKVVTNTSTMADIAYISSWGELHYVVRTGVSGMYSYFVATGIGNVGEFRTLYRMDGSIFRNGYNGVRTIAFPTESQIANARVLQDSTYQLANGTVYTKYDGVTYVQQDSLHGIYNNSAGTSTGVGLWMISPSHEYVNGGPMKQELTVHIDATTGDGVLLNMLSASHFGSIPETIPSGKIYGPWLVYFNNGSLANAQAQVNIERAAWPYSWLSNPHYPLARTTVTGSLHLANGLPAAGATVTLAAPGGDLYAQGAGYIFYTQADASGNFSIPKVRSGSYTLYAYANGGPTAGGAIGSVTDQYALNNVNVSGSTTNLGSLTWSPTRYTYSLWQIGTADRKSAEFNLGSVARQYGLFNQVPANLTYTIGQSTPANNWYYAQTKAGTWTINFNLSQKYTGNGHLTVAIAGEARSPSVTVSVNGTSVSNLPNFTNDSTIYRSANQSGYYHLVTINFSAALLKVGANSVTFRANSISNGSGIMYDTIKLGAD